MNARKVLSLAVAIGCLGSQASFAQVDDSIYGTHAVVFQPIQRSGALTGCSLVYRAVQADRVYQEGEPVIIVGSISVQRFPKNTAVGLKVGLKNFTEPLTRPYFAYLQTPNATTAKSRHEMLDGEEGFRLIAMGLDDAVMNVLLEMLEVGEVTIGFNRWKDGMDVLVPIDLKVFDAEPLPSQTFRRKRSPDAIKQFLGCFKKFLEQGISK